MERNCFSLCKKKKKKEEKRMANEYLSEYSRAMHLWDPSHNSLAWTHCHLKVLRLEMGSHVYMIISYGRWKGIGEYQPYRCRPCGLAQKSLAAQSQAHIGKLWMRHVTKQGSNSQQVCLWPLYRALPTLISHWSTEGIIPLDTIVEFFGSWSIALPFLKENFLGQREKVFVEERAGRPEK